MSKIINNDGTTMQKGANNIIKPVSMSQSGNVQTTQLRQLELIDPDAIQPTEFNILLKIISVEESTEGGIIKGDVAYNNELFSKTEAVLVACGQEAFTNSQGNYWEDKPQIGDKVMTAKYPGTVYRDEHFNLYRFAVDKDVLGIIKE